MSATIRELTSSRSMQIDELTGDDTHILRYAVTGTAYQEKAKELVKAFAPLRVDGLFRATIEIDTDPDTISEGIGRGVWEATVTYTTKDIGEPTFSFDTTGSDVHVQQNINSINTYFPADPAVQGFWKGAINVTPDGVQGVDIATGAFTWTETYSYESDDPRLSTDYRYTLSELTATVNNAAFRGYEAGEVLLVGAQATNSGTNIIEVTYNFAVSKNEENIIIGDITVPFKKGWDYLWVQYQDVEGGGLFILQEPQSVTIDQVYEYTDFSLLEIGD